MRYMWPITGIILGLHAWNNSIGAFTVGFHVAILIAMLSFQWGIKTGKIIRN